MQFASSIVTSSDLPDAVEALIRPIDAVTTRGMIDLAMLFATAHFEDDLPEVVSRVTAAFPNAAIMGCTAEGTIGNDKEVERLPSMSLLVGSLPEVDIRPFHIRREQLDSATTLFDWERMVGVSPENKPAFVALADPFRINIPTFVEGLNKFFPGMPLLGGVLSAGRQPDENRLIVCGDVHHGGVAGIALTGRLAVDTVVSQGCRPIGKPFVITSGERNVIHGLGGHAALEQLHNVLVGLSEPDEALAKQALFVGRVIDEHKDRFDRGDFLIHNIIGVDRTSGALGIAGHARVGATVQFHVRDAASADDDLRAMLALHADAGVKGALLFGCNGRGTNMWPSPGHDVGVLREVLGDVPVAGIFCGGEFGPVGGRNFIHGFTASIALMRDPPGYDASGENPP